jgi:hypothetical protein
VIHGNRQARSRIAMGIPIGEKLLSFDPDHQRGRTVPCKFRRGVGPFLSLLR